MTILPARLLLRRVGQLADALAPVGGRGVAQGRLLVCGDDQLAQRRREGEFERGLRLLQLGECGQSRVAPLGRGRDALLYVSERFEPYRPRRRQVARERARLGE